MAPRPVLPSVISDCFDLGVLSGGEKAYLCQSATLMVVDAGDFLCQEGDVADVVWIMVAGEIIFLTDDEPQPSASYATLFGEAGLLTELPPSRRVAIQAKETSVVLSISVAAFTREEGILPKLRPILAARQAHYLTTLPEAQVEDVFDMLRTCSDLSDLSDAQVQHLAAAAEIVQFEQGATILQQDASAEDVYVIVEGTVMFGDGRGSLSTAGTVFGENGLVCPEDPRRRVFAVAHSKVMVIKIPNSEFTPEILGGLTPTLVTRQVEYEPVSN